MDFIMDVIIGMTVVFGLFLLIGAILPTSSHREIRLHNRWVNFVLHLGAVSFYPGRTGKRLLRGKETI